MESTPRRIARCILRLCSRIFLSHITQRRLFDVHVADSEHFMGVLDSSFARCATGKTMDKMTMMRTMCVAVQTVF